MPAYSYTNLLLLFMSKCTHEQASEALADLLCHPSGLQHDYGGGRSQAAASALALKEDELHAQQLMFLLDM